MWINSWTEFAISDWDTQDFIEFKVWLCKDTGIIFNIDNWINDYHLDDYISRETLSINPVRWMIKESQKWLRIGFDLAKDRMTVHYQGVDVKRLIPKANRKIYRSKIVYASTPKIM